MFSHITKLVGIDLKLTHANKGVAEHVSELTPKMTSLDSKITKANGDDVTKSTGLQGVIMYGRNESFPNQLQAIDVNNGRLHVNTEEFASTGPLTNRTSLPAMQICGKSDGSNMQTLKVNSGGVMQTESGLTVVDHFTSASVSPGSTNTEPTAIQLSSQTTSVSFIVASTGVVDSSYMNVFPQVSMDGTTWYNMASFLYNVYPSGNSVQGRLNDFRPPHLRIRVNNSGGSTDTFTCKVVL